MMGRSTRDRRLPASEREAMSAFASNLLAGVGLDWGRTASRGSCRTG